MTKISRTIEVAVPAAKLWQVMDMRKWSQISSIFSEVRFSGTDYQTGAEGVITAGPGNEKVNYHARIVALEPEKMLQYERTGGPLPGTSTWEIVSNGRGCELHYTNNYRDTLADAVQQSLIKTMDRFLHDLRDAAENGKA